MSSTELPWNPYTGYIPSESIAIVAVTVISLSLGTHVYQLGRSGYWPSLALVLAACGELLGHIGRLLSSRDVYSRSAFLLQATVLILSPCFLSAICYTTLGELTTLLGGRFSPRFYVVVFVTADVICLAVQAAGGSIGSLAVVHYEDPKVGTKLMLAGIAAQLATTVIFLILAADFAITRRHALTTSSRDVKLVASTTLIVTLFIVIRGIYRTCELAEGWVGYLIVHQPYFLVFDALLMISCLVLFNIIHPSRMLRREGGAADTSSLDDDESRDKSYDAMIADDDKRIPKYEVEQARV
ncbi:uncharacterized protein L969DRAFT_55349 [Mixia osmundae IAM 14324]|uniref:uncharacterized protein n=1 Tax=Mixia osmundae (strain CBS 9802 / IAM 14324 / JCM 22182 / KY 12970) TaxID=764103 RepID=UPI0004A54AF8|nr:uncharacterized protein L969DRAFT_55349 [Mixia osmundae IAM 14324]KEI36259.1 hypothetical protein L969DRAFT_55349 [Mixia osmundae IAM 14324]